MATIPYKSRAGKRLSGATTIISANLGWNTQALLWWANRLALEPYELAYAMLNRIVQNDLDISEDIVTKFLDENSPELFDHKKAVKKAADAGTLAHRMAEDNVRGMLSGKKVHTSLEDCPDDVIVSAKISYKAFLKWKRLTKFKPLFTEVHIVCEEDMYGATPDLIAEIDGEVADIDYKTSKGIYPDHIVQAGAYIHAWNSNESYVMDGRDYIPIRKFCPKLILGGYYGLRFDKKNPGSFDYKHRNGLILETAYKVFKMLREIHSMKKELK